MSGRDSILAKPIKIGQREAANRFVINAMECCDADSQGSISEDAYNRYRQFVEGGASVILFESFTIQYDSVARKHQLGIGEPGELYYRRGSGDAGSYSCKCTCDNRIRTEGL